MSYSTLFDIDSNMLTTEAEVETRLLSKLFLDLGYKDKYIIPKKHLKALIVNDGRKTASKEVDFMLLDRSGQAKIIVEAKDPSINILAAWGQTASYALSYNRDIINEQEKVKWLLISNGHITGLFRNDSTTPVVTLQLSDFASGSPSYVTLRSYIKFDTHPLEQDEQVALPFFALAPMQLNNLFSQSHNLVWKKEKLAPADAFFEFCKFIFIKIQEDKKREKLPLGTPVYKVPLTEAWLEIQKETSPHPVRDILFHNLHSELENAIQSQNKKRIFDQDETLKLSASTCEALIKLYQTVNLSSIDEDLNGRMFEVFLSASIRGEDLGQFFTPRNVVDFMSRIALRNIDAKTPPRVLDACCGTAGFLIEVMAYLTSRLRNDTRLTNEEKSAIKNKICNESLFGIEANERVARIARINMYLHGDGGSHIYHGDGLDLDPQASKDMTLEQRNNLASFKSDITNDSFDIILTNPPFSMNYKASNEEEKRIIKQHELTTDKSQVKSSILFLNRYYELLKPKGEMLIILDDTIINGSSFEYVRSWLLEKFVLLGVHSLPFNAFFKAGANIKTTILHLRKKVASAESQCDIFMSVSNNIGHDNSTRDTPYRNNLTEILLAYLEWQRTGTPPRVIRNNSDPSENLECSQQYWILPANELSLERYDAFFYCIDLKQTYQVLESRKKREQLEIIYGKDLVLRSKLSFAEKAVLKTSDEKYKYIEIGDVTKFGLITGYVENYFDLLPSRGEYQVHTGDILLAINNSSRGTAVIVPPQFDNCICTSGFLVIVPENNETGLLLWYALRSEACRKQIYYLAQTASQPELKLDAWKKYFSIPIPSQAKRKEILEEAAKYYHYLELITDIKCFQVEM